MPPKNNIELGPGEIRFIGLDESEMKLDISEVDGEIEFADDTTPIPLSATRELIEATFTCESMEINREWTLAYCKICRQPIPITQFDALTLGTTGWTCPLCTVIERMKRRGVVRDCCSSGLI